MLMHIHRQGVNEDMSDIKKMWKDMFPNREFKEIFKLTQPGIAEDICEEISHRDTGITYGELVDTINGFYSEIQHVKKENQELKAVNTQIGELLSSIGLKTDVALKLLHK